MRFISIAALIISHNEQAPNLHLQPAHAQKSSLADLYEHGLARADTDFIICSSATLAVNGDAALFDEAAGFAHRSREGSFDQEAWQFPQSRFERAFFYLFRRLTA